MRGWSAVQAVGVDLSVSDGKFADDAVLLAASHGDAEHMLTEFVDVPSAFGLSVNMVKTLFVAVGHGITDCDRAPLSIHDAQVKHASRFLTLAQLLHLMVVVILMSETE